MSAIFMKIDTTEINPGHMADLLRMAAFRGVHMVECKTCKHTSCSKTRNMMVGPMEENIRPHINGCSDWEAKK